MRHEDTGFNAVWLSAECTPMKSPVIGENEKSNTSWFLMVDEWEYFHNINYPKRPLFTIWILIVTQLSSLTPWGVYTIFTKTKITEIRVPSYRILRTKCGSIKRFHASLKADITKSQWIRLVVGKYFWDTNVAQLCCTCGDKWIFTVITPLSLARLIANTCVYSYWGKKGF